MYLIFGENYKTALIDYLKTSCQQKLKEENDRYLRNLNVINRAKGNMLRKSAEKRSHEGVRKGILKSYNSRLEFATTLNMDTLTID